MLKFENAKQNIEQLLSGVTIPNETQWFNSANVLCNYMKELWHLELILTNHAIIPRYVVEPIRYLNIPGYERIAFPMTCFCDIPFSKVDRHKNHYGGFGIAFDKITAIRKFKVQPIHYINDKSALANDFRFVFSKYADYDDFAEEYEPLLDYLLSTLVFMKPILNTNNIEKHEDHYIFQDECEWRYVPTRDTFPNNLDYMLVNMNATQKAANAYSETLKDHPEVWLNFEWEDVRCIIVPTEPDAEQLIQKINALSIIEKVKYTLISKIEVSERFRGNL